MAEPTLQLHFQHARDILGRTYPNGRLGGVRVDGSLKLPVGERVNLVVKVKEPAERTFRLKGQVAWARHTAVGDLRPCYGVDFVGDDESGRDRLLDFAAERVPVEATRFLDRLSVNLPVKIVHAGKAWKESLADLSLGGAFVQSARSLPIGTVLEFQLRPPMSLRAISIPGKVAWTRRAGEKKGFGIEFVAATAKDAERLRKLLDRVRADRAEAPPEPEPEAG